MRLLVAIDDAPPARDALELARVLCAATGSSVLLVTVLYAGPLPMEFALLPEEEAREAEPLFKRAREALAGIEVETHAYGGGSPGAIITSLSEHEELDGIVLGSPRRHGLDRLLRGSVALNVLNGAKCDVYVAPPGYAEATHDGLRTVAVGYLGTPESRRALHRAVELAGPSGEIRLLTVAEPPPPLAFVNRQTTSPTDPAAVLEEGVKGVRGEASVVPIRLEGRVAPALEKACGEGVDLLILGSRGYGPTLRALLGSVSGQVFRHAPCPLLVTKRG